MAWCSARPSRSRVVELLRIDPGGRVGGDVPDVVGARAARGEARFGEALEDRARVDRGDLAHLQVRARRDVGVTAAEVLGDGGHGAQLRGVQHAVGIAQAQHERVLRRRDVEEPVELVEEDVGALRELAARGIGRDLVPHVERMLGALGLFLARELAARGDRAVLRGEMDGLGPPRCCRRIGPRRPARRSHAAREPVEEFLLLCAERPPGGLSHRPPWKPPPRERASLPGIHRWRRNTRRRRTPRRR